MAQSLSKLLVHIVFATKDRYPYLTDAVRAEFHAYAASVLQSCESPALIINSMPDHVHILCVLSKNRALCDVVEEVKRSTSRWIKSKGGMLAKFYWQHGYGVFSVSQSNVAAVLEYVANQEEHHWRMSFQDELRELFRKHAVEFDERYVWD